MRKLIVTITFFALLISGVPANENSLNITSGGSFTLVIGNSSGHYAPALDFFRRFERVVRRVGNLEESSSGRQLICVLDENQPSGSCSFEHSRIYRKQVLKLPTDYQSLLDAPSAGRVLTAAFVQSRLGNQVHEPLPEAACWIADGLWAEFVQRERSGEQAIRFTWLPELRNVVENGVVLQLNCRTLMPPVNIRPGAADWCFYVQKAQLMLETANLLGSSRTNLLKDYCFLLFGKQLAAEECFDQTFSAAAKRKLFTRLTPEEVVPADETIAGRTALNRIALKSLYSQYVPLNPGAAKRIFDRICKVEFKQQSSGIDITASITDLPFLVEKYDNCVAIPRIKIFEINELAATAPSQLRPELYQLTYLLSEIGRLAPEKVSSQMKKSIAVLEHILQELLAVDQILAAEEKAIQPLLFEWRFFMNGNWQETPLPGNVKSFMDTVERALQR